VNRYFDASALVKLFVAEKGSDQVRKWVAAGPVFTARLSLVEIDAAVTRRHRAGDLGPGSLRTFDEDFARVADTWILQEFTPEVVARARTLVRETPLRAADAIHLASCQRLSGDLGEPMPMVCYDRVLGEAAARVGIRVLGRA
jgi:predicted nucleic acid-binding protein